MISASYWKFAQQHYRKRDKGTSEIDNIRYALRPLKELYAATLVEDFGPLALKALQGRMIEDGLSRGVINSRIGKIKRIFRWAVSEELAPNATYFSFFELFYDRTNVLERDLRSG